MTLNQQRLADAVLFRDVEAVVRLLSSNVSANFQTDDGRAPLCDAAANDPALTSILLNHGADPDYVDGTSFTPLYYAIILNNLSCVQILLAAGADMHLCDVAVRGNALHVAAAHASQEVFDFVLKSDESGCINEYDSIYNTPLMVAVRHKNRHAIVQLASHCRDVNAADPEGPQETALHIAAIDANYAVVRDLVQAGANRYAINRIGQRPIDIYLAVTPSASLVDPIAGLLA
jgi:ankyrin repeat protein